MSIKEEISVLQNDIKEAKRSLKYYEKKGNIAMPDILKNEIQKHQEKIKKLEEKLQNAK